MDPKDPIEVSERSLPAATEILSALAHATRLKVYMELLASLPDGKASGDIAADTGTPPTTMSAHLAVLMRAGLVSTERRGKSIIYTADATPARRLAKLFGSAAGSAVSS